jgi:O-acetyl-ADP-ribose deacetylase (regulator of RNase III)
MKIYIIDESKQKIEIAKQYFKNTDIEFVDENFSEFMKREDVECIVSPANSFGLMDGGYDLAITEWFGDQLQERVQKYIIKNYYGEQPTGTSFIIKANDKGQKLIHTPTMQTPRMILDPFIIYQSMRSTLMCAYKNKVKSILIPLFGGGCGRVNTRTIAKMMRLAYDQIHNPPKQLDWNYAHEVEVLY